MMMYVLPVCALLGHWLNCELRCPGSLGVCYHHERNREKNKNYEPCHVYQPLWPSHTYVDGSIYPYYRIHSHTV